MAQPRTVYHTKKQRLGDLCPVLSGAFFRVGVPQAWDGKPVPVVQARDIANGVVEPGTVVCTSFEAVPVGARSLKVGDVLLQPRGQPKAGVVGSGFEGAIAAAPLYILHTPANRLEPSWLAMVLNSAAVQRKLAAAAVGTSVPQVPRSAIDNLEIELPPIEVQRRIVTLASLVRREREIADAIFKHRMSMIVALGRPQKGRD